MSILLTPGEFNDAIGIDVLAYESYRPLLKRQATKIAEWLDGWCEHTTNPMQRRYLCSACRRLLLKEVE